MAGFYDALEQEKRKAQQLSALQAQQQSMDAYNQQKAQVDNKYNGGLGGFLGSLIGGIGKGVSDVGNTLIDMFGSGIASARDLGSIITTGKSAGEDEKWLKYRRGTDNIDDARLKTAGQALNAATTLATTAVPMASAGTALGKAASGIATNTISGALGGVGSELQEQGKDARLDSALNRAISGAAAGAATGALGRKIGVAKSDIGKKLLNNKVVTSTLGRGALSGAVGGGVGAGTSAALGGGDILGSALQGAGSGAISGAAQAGITSAARSLGNATVGKAIRNGWEKQQDRIFENAIKNPSNVKEPVYLGELSQKNFDDVSRVLKSVGLNDNDTNAITIDNNAMYLTPEGAQHLHNKRIEIGNMPAESVRQTMRNATRNGVVLDEPSRANNAVMGSINGDGKKVDIAYLNTTEDGNLSLESTYPEKSGKTSKAIKRTLDASQTRRSTDTDGIDLAAGNISALQGSDSSISQNDTYVNTDEPFLAYGESELGKKTRGSQTADALRRFGNTLEGAQTNVTRAAARDLGIESPGKVVESVRKKTGITNLETQAALAKELTGGENSLMDTIQKNALSASEDGSKYLADATKVLGEVEGIVDKYATSSAFKGENSIEKLKSQIRSDVLNRSQDLIQKSNNFKAQAQELRGKSIVNASEGDSAKAKIYSEIASKLDDLSYNAIPKENVNDMFDATINEMKGRARIAQNNGRNDIAKAYNTLATELDAEPRTIEAYRSFKKPFVDVSKIARLTAQAENGAGVQMNTSLLGGVRRFVNKFAERPTNALLAKAGSVVNNIADAVDAGNIGTSVQPMSPELQTILGNYIGRTQGNIASNSMVQNARREEDYNNLEELFNSIQPTASMAQTAPVNAYASQLETQMADIANGMNLALAAGDLESYNTLANLYKTAYNTYKLQAGIDGSDGSNLTTSEKNQLAKIQSAGTALDQLESLYKKAGGGQGIIGGNIANFLGGIGLNSDVSTYNQLAQGLINQIGAAIGKTDSLNTEGEVQRALSLVPKITDDNQTAMNKLETLRQMLRDTQGTYNQLYNA